MKKMLILLACNDGDQGENNEDACIQTHPERREGILLVVWLHAMVWFGVVWCGVVWCGVV